MKRVVAFIIALGAVTFSFAQTTTGDYKHPLAKEKKEIRSEKFSTETIVESQDYKHPKTKKTEKRVRLRKGSPAADYKHPIG